MRYKGMQIICDRCGMTEFFVPLEKGSVDSSHSLSDYEGTKNWTNELIYGKYYDFCPLCSGQCKRMILDFVKPINSIAEKEGYHEHK